MRKFESTAQSIWNWARRAERDGGACKVEDVTRPEREELTKLRRENHCLRQERDIWPKVAAIYHVPTAAGFLLLAVMLDAWPRRIVGWSMSTDLRTSLLRDALDMAVTTREPADMVHHSDQGSQNAPIRDTKRLVEPGTKPSIGSVGGRHDNPLTQTINRLCKARVIHRPGPRKSFDAVEFASRECVDWFNYRRLLEPVGNIPPAEAEAPYHAALEQPALAA